MPRRGNRRSSNSDPSPNDDGDDEARGFNNPNIEISVKFKNKIRNNNYEFIVTIEPEKNDDATPRPKKKNSELCKQYKVKRNLYEFQELFNYLETKNP